MRAFNVFGWPSAIPPRQSESVTIQSTQAMLFPDVLPEGRDRDQSSSTFLDNLALPVHRWFRYSAGYSAAWVRDVIRQASCEKPLRVFDPFAGSATTLLAAEQEGVESLGIDAHPFVVRIARAKLQWRSDPEAYRHMAHHWRRLAKTLPASIESYPKLIRTCYDDVTLAQLDRLRRAYERIQDNSAASELVWLTMVAILRKTSMAGTAQWQYVLPKKKKRAYQDVDTAVGEMSRVIYGDMLRGQSLESPRASCAQADARMCDGVSDAAANLVITSPPYPNNYDYADATRLEMSFMGEVRGWGELQQAVRQYLIRSCSQHFPDRSIDLDEVVSSPELEPLHSAIRPICRNLDAIRMTKGGKKTYHLMIACYFRDLALVWRSLRRVCRRGSTVCFVIGDSAPYGVYIPVIPWLTALAEAAGFRNARFERTRDRNVKWKNRKHRVPLQEGRLWVEG